MDEKYEFTPAMISDLDEAKSYASINCRYYIKMLARLVDREHVDSRQAHAVALASWSTLQASIERKELTVEHYRDAILVIEATEPQPPDRALMLEAQEDENEALWGKGFRTHEQVLAELERRLANA